MAEFKPEESSFAKVRDKVIVLSGASTGIGAATASLLHRHGAKIVFGDVNDGAGGDLCRGHEGMDFVLCDVTKYGDVYGLFARARELHGRVDHAVSCAGIFEQGNWFDPELTIDSVKQEGNGKVLDVNVKGTMDFARIAAVFLRSNSNDAQRKGKGIDAEDKSLVLLSSVNAFRESPGLYLYQTSEHAIQGLLRSSRKPLWERDGIRVNAVNPGVTDTPMAHHIAVKFKAAGLYSQSAGEVAKIIVGLVVDEKMVGKSVYVEGGDGWEFEDSFIEQQGAWLGEEPTRRMKVNTEAVLRGVLLEK